MHSSVGRSVVKIVAEVKWHAVIHLSKNSNLSRFLLMDEVTSMSLVGSRMALAHSLTHSILINLSIKLELNNFLLPPLLSIVCLRIFSHLTRGD